MNLKQIIFELKRRHVFKAAVAYLVVAWMVIQISSILLPTFNAPPYFMQVLVLILSVGFPIWIIFSWLYDFTSDGIIKTSKTTDTTQFEERLKTQKRLNLIIIFSLTIAVILLVFNQIRNQPFVEKGKAVLNTELSSAIAILPFTTSKPDPEYDYLNYALADQIIGDLSYLKNLEVKSSNSIRKYTNQEIDLKNIGSDLDVTYALVGNYLIENNRIRLSVELINIDSQELAWRSGTIEVDYKNTFELLDVVANKVVNGLNIEFTQQELDRIIKDIPNDPLAYEYYLRSLSYPLTSAGDELAIKMLNQAISLDSLYAPSYAELGFRSQRVTHFEMKDPENYKSSEAYYLKALELNPENLNALSYLSVFYTEDSNTEEAVSITKKMLEVNPNNAAARFSLGYLYRYIGLLQKSISEMEMAINLDPDNPNYRRIAVSYICINQFEKSLEALRKGEETSYTKIWSAITLFRMDKYKEAMIFLNEIIENQNEPYIVASSIAIKSTIQGDIQKGLEATKLIEEANIADAEGWYFYGTMYASLEDYDSALRCLNESVNRGYYNYPFIKNDPLLDNLRTLPEFNKILEQSRIKHEYYKSKFQL